MRPRCLSWVWRLAVPLLVFGWGGAAGAQTFPRSLETIEVVQAGDREALHFVFSQPFQGRPLEEHSPGRFSLRFSGTGSKVSHLEQNIKDGKLLQSFRVAQSRLATTASFTLVDPNATLKGKLAFSGKGNRLRVDFSGAALAHSAGAGEQAGGEKDLLREMTDRIAGQGPATQEQPPPTAAAKPGELGKFSGGDWLPTLFTLALSLGVMILALYALLYGYNRFFGSRLGSGGNSQAIRLIANFNIGPKQRVVILDIAGEKVACGVTPNQISFLTRLEGGRAAQRRPGARPSPGGSAPEATSGGATTTGPAGAGKSDPVQQFADALKEKVGSLKRLK